MTHTISRRTVLSFLGIRLALPLVPSLMTSRAGAASARKHFVAVYFPNGGYMPNAEDGNWTFEEALAPLAGDLRQNTMILRGLFNGFSGLDAHWQNCAGFLSCRPIEIGDPGVARCGKSLDQYIADALPSPRRSLEIGEVYYHKHLLNDHPGYSNDYLNRISWQTADRFRTPEADPSRFFVRLFTDGSAQSEARVKYLQARNKSILDHLYKDATRLSHRLSSNYQQVLQAHLQSVRELEQELSQDLQQCSGAPPAPEGDFREPNVNYRRRFELLHEMLVIAIGCGLSNVATLMYGPGVSDELCFSEEIGVGDGHHACAHHGSTPEKINRLKQINGLQVSLLADLLTRLKRQGLLSDTLVIYGSDMSDGELHLTRNLPFLLCGEGTDLRFGEEVGSRERPRPLSDLYMEVLPLLGIMNQASFGTGECASTGMPLGLIV